MRLPSFGGVVWFAVVASLAALLAALAGVLALLLVLGSGSSPDVGARVPEWVYRQDAVEPWDELPLPG